MTTYEDVRHADLADSDAMARGTALSCTHAS